MIEEGPQRSELFLVGLFSQPDAVLDRPLAELLAEIQASPELCRALLNEEGKRYQLLSLCVALERGQWDRLSGLAAALQLDESALSDIYLKAVTWAQATYL